MLRTTASTVTAAAAAAAAVATGSYAAYVRNVVFAVVDRAPGGGFGDTLNLQLPIRPAAADRFNGLLLRGDAAPAPAQPPLHTLLGASFFGSPVFVLERGILATVGRYDTSSATLTACRFDVGQRFAAWEVIEAGPGARLKLAWALKPFAICGTQTLEAGMVDAAPGTMCFTFSNTIDRIAAEGKGVGSGLRANRPFNGLIATFHGAYGRILTRATADAFVANLAALE